LERDVLFLSEALGPPYFGGCRRCVGDVGARHSARGGKPERTTKHRAPSLGSHTVFLPRLCRVSTRTRSGCRLPPHYKTVLTQTQTLIGAGAIDPGCLVQLDRG